MEDGHSDSRVLALNKGETGAPHRLNASLIYELPFGAGKTWLNDGGMLSHIAAGWQINTFFSWSPDRS